MTLLRYTWKDKKGWMEARYRISSSVSPTCIFQGNFFFASVESYQRGSLAAAHVAHALICMLLFSSCAFTLWVSTYRMPRRKAGELWGNTMHGRQIEHNHHGRISHDDLYYATRCVGKMMKVMPQLVRSCVKSTPDKRLGICWSTIARMEMLYHMLALWEIGEEKKKKPTMHDVV